MQIVASIVLFCILSGLFAYLIFRARNWIAFWRRMEPTKLRVVDAREIEKTSTDDGHRETYTVSNLTYRALDGPLAGRHHASAVQTNPPLFKVGEEVDGFCDPVLERIESARALWFIYGTLCVLGLIVGYFWLQSLNWLISTLAG